MHCVRWSFSAHCGGMGCLRRRLVPRVCARRAGGMHAVERLDGVCCAPVGGARITGKIDPEVRSPGRPNTSPDSAQTELRLGRAPMRLALASATGPSSVQHDLDAGQRHHNHSEVPLHQHPGVAWRLHTAMGRGSGICASAGCCETPPCARRHPSLRALVDEEPFPSTYSTSRAGSRAEVVWALKIP